MFSKNLRFYRLKKEMSKKELADKANLTAMAITHYENGTRSPNMEILKALAKALDVRVSDFLTVRNVNLSFQHGEFRKNASLQQNRQEYVREIVEEYFGRFFSTIELLGGDVLPEAPECHVLPITGNAEEDARAMRRHLGLGIEGPIHNLTSVLENKGILVYVCDIDNSKFSGMNGFVNDRPYIIVNGAMSPERNRSTAAHEMAHLFFKWPDDMDEKAAEKYATAISGAFLFPKNDAIRELGVRRASVSYDMTIVCAEYGISMMMLAKRARIAKIISDSAEKQFYMLASQIGWRTNEPSRISPEKPVLFEQLVYRAINEEEISIQKGAELLQMPYDEVASHCCFKEGEGQ